MFNTKDPIDITIPAPEGDKKVTVRFPTDEEFVTRARKTKTLIKSLGRGKTTTDVSGNEDADVELLAKIKQSGDELDPAEAALVISRLSRCNVSDSVREGNHFVITLSTPGGKTVHNLKMPSAKQMQQHARNVVSVINGRHGQQEMKLNLQASGDLYDQLLEKAEGYAAAVPIIHKSDVVGEINALLNADSDEGDIEGF